MLQQKRENLLDSFRKKQPFRVSVGKSKWVNYNTFKPEYNLREVLKDEIVIEFDSDIYEKKLNKKWKEMNNEEKQVFHNFSRKAINDTGQNLVEADLVFEIWEHGGKSPHLHIHNLPISQLEKDELREFKRFFIKKFVSKEYEPYVDYSLCGIHLIAIEWVKHWKGCYGVKKLLI